MAMTIAVGFVVDDAIVMVEVIWKRIEHGEKPFEAALAGAGEIGFTILTISISLIAVFTPLMFMGGVVGPLMREFALTLSAAVRGLDRAVADADADAGWHVPEAAEAGRRTPSPRRWSAASTARERLRPRASTWCCATQRLTLAVFLATDGARRSCLYATVPTGFFPQQDTGFINGVLLTSQDASFTKTTEKIQQVAQVHRSRIRPSSVFGVFVGGRGANQANLYISLKPKDGGRKATRRPDHQPAAAQARQLVGVQTFLQAAQDINVGGRAGQAQYQYTLSDSGPRPSSTPGRRSCSPVLQRLPELSRCQLRPAVQAAAVNLTIDRDAAARFGISPPAIDAAIYDLIGQDEVAQYFTQTEQLPRGDGGAAEPAGLAGDLFNRIYPGFAAHRQDRAAVAVREGRPERHTQPDDQPPGRVPGRDPLVQPRARRGARPGDPGR